MLETHPGIVLHSRKHGEADRILTVLLDTDETLDLRYHGIRASQKRSQIAGQPGNLVEAVFYRKPDSTIHSIKELSLIREHRIAGRYSQLKRLAAILGLIRAAHQGELAGLFQLCEGALLALESLAISARPSPESAESPESAAQSLPSGFRTANPQQDPFLQLLGFLIVRLQKMHGALSDPARCSRCDAALWNTETWPPASPMPSYWNHPDLEFLCANCALRENQLAREENTRAAIWVYAAARLRYERFEQELRALPFSFPDLPLQLSRDVQEFLGPIKELDFDSD